MGGNGNVEQWLRDSISWHQLVEWYQFYLSNPFGEERADLRSAIAGCTIANEVRIIGKGLAGKSFKPIQVKDLLLKLDKQTKTRDQETNYYQRWEASITSELAAHQKGKGLSKGKPRGKRRGSSEG